MQEANRISAFQDDTLSVYIGNLEPIVSVMQFSCSTLDTKTFAGIKMIKRSLLPLFQ